MEPLVDRLRSSLDSRYSIQREIGSGGFAKVFLGDDLKHHRKVAIKVLRPELAAAVGPDRFHREIEIAAPLVHPHILTIHDSGETEGLLYYVMPYVQGESLRQRLSREGPLPVETAVAIASEVADGLEYAHRSGVVHRDIKPDNILLTEGHAVIVDFGVAKAVAAAGAEKLTASGLAIGSPAYMSPELAGAESEVDARSDIYALGCVLFEMLTGKPPFGEGAARAVLVRQMVENAPSAREARAEVPLAVSQTIEKALSKAPDHRFDSAAEFAEALCPSQMKSLEVHRWPMWQVVGAYLLGSWAVLRITDASFGVFSLPAWTSRLVLVLVVGGFLLVLATAIIQEAARRRAVTPTQEERWGAIVSAERRMQLIFTWRHAFLAGVVAFTLLGTLIAGWVVTRTLGIGPAATLVAQGVLDERASIVLADFMSQDPVLGRAATEAFRVDLSQSPNVKLADPRQVADALERMARDPTELIDLETAREIAEREGFQAAIGGRIIPTGIGFFLSAVILAAETGELLASQRVSASDSSEIIDAIDILSHRLRERIGESLRSLRSAPPLARVTTGSLEALRLYSQADHVIQVEDDWDRGIVLLEQALELDSAFAMAWRKLGAVLSNQDRPRSAWIVPLSKAFQHRRRLTERERYLAAGTYYQLVQEDFEAAITAYESILALNRDEAIALNNLAVIYAALGDSQRLEEMAEKAFQVDSIEAIPYQTLIVAKVVAGKLAEAEELFERFSLRFEGAPIVEDLAPRLAAARFDYEAADAMYRKLRERERGDLGTRSATSAGLAALAAIRGRLVEATSYSLDGIEAERQRGRPSEALLFAIDVGLRDALVRGEPELGLRAVEDALADHPLDSIPAADRPYLRLVRLYALAGLPDRARTLMADYEADVPKELRQADTQELYKARGFIHLAEERHDEAIVELLRANRGSCVRRCPVLARAYDAAGQIDSALATYERYVASPELFELVSADQFNIGPFYERLGELYDARGDWKKAAEYYARFVELWRDADAELRPRVQTAERRLNTILREHG